MWALEKPDALGQAAFTALQQHAFTASVINYWELVLKKDKPGALLQDPVTWWDQYVVRAGIPTLGVRVSHIRALARMPALHRDPFDRLLVAQALADGLTLLTKDMMLSKYDVPIIW